MIIPTKILWKLWYTCMYWVNTEIERLDHDGDQDKRELRSVADGEDRMK